MREGQRGQFSRVRKWEKKARRMSGGGEVTSPRASPMETLFSVVREREGGDLLLLSSYTSRHGRIGEMREHRVTTSRHTRELGGDGKGKREKIRQEERGGRGRRRGEENKE